MIQGTTTLSYAISLEIITNEEGRKIHILNYKLHVAGEWLCVDSVVTIEKNEDKAIEKLYSKAVKRWHITKGSLKEVA